MRIIVEQKPSIRVVAAKARGPVRVGAAPSRVLVRNVGRAGPQGVAGPPTPLPEIPDLTLIFDNQLI